MATPGPAPVQPAEMAEIELAVAKARFNQEIRISDDNLKAMDEGDFRAWMEAMIQGIVCFAEDCNAEICNKQTRPGFDKGYRKRARDTAKRRTKQSSEWRRDWSEKEFQEWIPQLKPKSRINRMQNFRYLADHFRRGEWVHLVSVTDVAREGGIAKDS